MDMNQLARQLAHALATGAEVEGGLALRPALGQARLDATLAAAARIDQLLFQIRQRARPTPESWARLPGSENFTLALGFHLGEIVAGRTGLPIAWYDAAQAREQLPADALPAQAPWARLVGIVGDTMVVPLGPIEDRLFHEHIQMSCHGYADQLTQRVLERIAGDEDRHCAAVLDAFFHGTPLAGGLALPDALARAAPDFSLDSLARLDALLQHLRREALAPEGMLNDPAGQNFVRWIAFYLGVTLARHGLPLQWMSYAQLRGHLPELAYQFETSSACTLSGRVHFPLGLVTEILFAPPPTRTLRGFADDVLTRVG